MFASLLTIISSPTWLVVWEWAEALSIIVIGVGCWGEGWAEHRKFKPVKTKTAAQVKKWYKRVFWRMVVIGLGIELIAFGFSFVASNREIEGLKRDNLSFRTNVVSLETAVRELAHLYDQSTNALEEARIRLAAIKPEKDKLIDLLNAISPEIVEQLKNGNRIHKGEVELYQVGQLEEFARNPGTSNYIQVERIGGLNFSEGGRQKTGIQLILDPSLLQ